MIETMDYRTKTLMIETANVTVDHYWPIAIDIGYSSVKGFSPNGIFAFPSYAKNLKKNPKLYGELHDDEILYRDGDTGDIWRVGRSAQEMVNNLDTEDSEQELFGRTRYFSQLFKVLLRTGLALGTLSNGAGEYNETPIYVQTGLPPKYLDEDSRYLIEVLSGTHEFAIKTSQHPNFVNMKLNIPKQNIEVMSQPEGTLMNLVMDDHGNGRSNARTLFQSNIIIFDAGFGTLDLFDIKNRKSSSKETFSQFGMREILDRTAKKIKKETGVFLPPSAMQNALESGTVLVKKRNGIMLSSRKQSFSDLLESATEEVCREAVEKIINIYDGLFEYQYLVLTGGTSAAWEKYIREYFQEVEDLTIIAGNEYSRSSTRDDLPDDVSNEQKRALELEKQKSDIIFCNVRGYYMCLINYLRRISRK